LNPYFDVLTKTEGIVLKTLPYTEANQIVTFLTLKTGIVKAYAKSSRKTKSRFGSSLEPFTHSLITLWGKEQSMPKITQSDILRPFQKLRENYQDFVHASRIAEIIITAIPEGAANQKLFLFILNILNLLESSDLNQKDAVYLTSQIRLLSVLGYAPRLKGCGKCSVKSYFFYPRAGTILCRKGAGNQSAAKELPLKVTAKTIHFYSHSIGWPIQTSGRLKPSRETVTELSALLDAHITYILSKRLHTSDFLAGV
jgi:DNA repair protein RecO (recombination protein O)